MSEVHCLEPTWSAGGGCSTPGFQVVGVQHLYHQVPTFSDLTDCSVQERERNVKNAQLQVDKTSVLSFPLSFLETGRKMFRKLTSTFADDIYHENNERNDG